MAKREREFAWLIVLMFFAGGVISYIDRAALGIVMPQVRRDLSLSNTDYGLVVNAFLGSYAVFYILGGWLTDRLGSRLVYPLMVASWSAANMLHVFARSLFSLSLFRAFLGMSEGGFFPAAIRGATEWFRPTHRSKAIAVYFCGSSLGALITPPLVAWTTFRYSWRAAFGITGALGLPLLPLWFFLHRRIHAAYGTWNPAPGASAPENRDSLSHKGFVVRSILRRKKYWLLLASRAICDTVWFFYIFWMPGYFQEVRAFSLGEIGRTLWIPYVAADACALGSGWIGSALIKSGRSIDSSRKIVLIVCAALCLTGSATSVASSSALALAIVSVTLSGALAYGSTINTAITEIVPARHVAVLYGITGAAGTLLAAISQPIIGHVVDASGYEFVFIGSGAAFALALALALAAGKIEPIVVN